MDNPNLLSESFVVFYDEVPLSKVKFVVIISKYKGQWVFCKHKGRETYELPGGMREDGEEVVATAKRELIEETGALKFSIKPLFGYSTKSVNFYNNSEAFGMVYFSEIYEFSSSLMYEIDKRILLYTLPLKWAYESIHPKIMMEYFKRYNN